MARKYTIDRVDWMDSDGARPGSVWVRWMDEVRITGVPPVGEESVEIHPSLEDPAALRELANLIEAGPPVDVGEVDRIVKVLVESGRFDMSSERELRTVAESLWRGGVRPR